MTDRQNPTSQWLLVIVILTITLSAQLFRVLFPLVVFNPSATPEVMARHLMIVYAVPFVIPFIVRWLGARRFLLACLIGLALLRFGLQLSGSSTLSIVLASIGVVLAFSAQALIISRVVEIEPRTIGTGFIGGLALDAALNSAFLTWDYVWQRTPIAFVVALIVSELLLVAVWQQREVFRQPDQRSMNGSLWLALLGPFWMLELTVLNNPAYVNTVGAWGIAVVLYSNWFGQIISPALARLRSPIIRLGMIAVIGWLPFTLEGLTSGWDAALVIITIQVFVCSMLFRVLFAPSHAAQQPIWKLSISLGFGSLIFLGLVALHYAGYQIKAPSWTSAAVQAAAGVLIALSVFREQPLSAPVSVRWRLVFVPVIPVVILFLFLLCLPMTFSGLNMPVPDKQQLRFMTYNIHQGANMDGWIDLEGIAAAIEAQQPDVIVLNEVVRGQIITGSTDIITWLSLRLGMNSRFAPATDLTYGNGILTRFPIRLWSAGKLPQSNAAQPRSYIESLLLVDNQAGAIRVYGTHLDHLDSTVRIPQVEHLLTDATRQTIIPFLIAGDMNALPDSPEMALFKNSGLQNAQDLTGNSGLFTFPANNPRVRIDYIFGSPDLSFSDFVIPHTTASDHLPAAVTVSWTIED